MSERPLENRDQAKHLTGDCQSTNKRKWIFFSKDVREQIDPKTGDSLRGSILRETACSVEVQVDVRSKAPLVNRSLTTADLNVPDTTTTGACGLHAAMTPSPEAIASNLPGSNAPHQDAIFALLNRSAPAPDLAPNASFHNPAQDAVFADPVGAVGATLQPMRLAALNTAPIFGTIVSQDPDESPFT